MIGSSFRSANTAGPEMFPWNFTTKPSEVKMKKWILTATSLGLIFVLCFTWALSQSDQPIKNLSLKDAEIHSVLSFLADYGKVNIVVAPSVQAKVTLNLNNVTWRQALDIVMKNYSLAGVQ